MMVGRRRAVGHGSRCAGMTLLELLVAMAILAVVSVMAYGGLRSVLDADEVTAARSADLEGLQRAFSLIGGDLAQLAARPIRDAYGDSRPALDATRPQALEWTRSGWPNPTGRLRSTLQRVAYTAEDGRLVRDVWHVLDRAQDTRAESAVVLTGVTGLRVRLLGPDREWHDGWPITDREGALTSLPLAVDVILETERWGTLRRIVLLPETT